MCSICSSSWSSKIAYKDYNKFSCIGYDIIVDTEQSTMLKIKLQKYLVSNCDYHLISKIEVKGRVTRIYGKSNTLIK